MGWAYANVRMFKYRVTINNLVSCLGGTFSYINTKLSTWILGRAS